MSEAHACVSRVLPFSWVRFSVFTQRSLWTEARISAHRAHIVLGLFPSSSVALEQICIFRTSHWAVVFVSRWVVDTSVPSVPCCTESHGVSVYACVLSRSLVNAGWGGVVNALPFVSIC